MRFPLLIQMSVAPAIALLPAAWGYMGTVELGAFAVACSLHMALVGRIHARTRRAARLAGDIAAGREPRAARPGGRRDELDDVVGSLHDLASQSVELADVADKVYTRDLFKRD